MLPLTQRQCVCTKAQAGAAAAAAAGRRAHTAPPPKRRCSEEADLEHEDGDDVAENNDGADDV
jgi:hypothetical protein